MNATDRIRESLTNPGRTKPWVTIAAADAERLCDLADAARRYVDSADECRYDHHGHCQEHWSGEGPCPIAEARHALTHLYGEDPHA